MDTLSAMRTFRQVVVSGGFTAAGRHLGRATSSISRQITELEAEIGAQLLNRTTRKLSLTEAGHIYLDRVTVILDQIDETHLAVAEPDGDPSGVLRIAMPTGVGREVVSVALAEFLNRYPNIRTVLSVNDSYTDLIAEQIDVAIRIGAQRDSNLVAAKIGDSRRVICASPAYLDRAGHPNTPADLQHHNCLTFRDHPGHNRWSFRGANGVESVRVTGNVFVRSADALSACALAGLGIILLPDWNIGMELRAHQLVAVLRDYQVEPEVRPVYAVYPPSSYLPPKVRVFIDFLRDRFRTDAYTQI